MHSAHWIGPLLIAVVAACTLNPSPTHAPSPSAPPASAESIVIGLQLPPFVPAPFVWMSNATPARVSLHSEIVSRLVHNALYRYDASLSPVPDLAAKPCTVSDNNVVITCDLVAARFHDGSAMTADDVVFTYEIGRRSNCLFAFGYCIGEVLEAVSALDDDTVEFRLTRPDATFLTLAMPDVLIDSRAVVEAAYAPLGDRAANLDPDDYQALADEISGQLAAGEPDCGAPLSRAGELFEAAGLEPPPRGPFTRAGGVLDECLYAQSVRILMTDLAQSLQTTGLDAIARAYRALAFNRAPIGTGPFRFLEVVEGKRARLEANPNYHHGAPAAPGIEVVALPDIASAEAAFLEGDVHWFPIPQVFPELIDSLRAESNVRFVEYADPSFFMLAYNLRDGMLFADLNLRSAVDICIDKPSTVGAAVARTGEPMYSFVTPASWAYRELPRPSRDVPKARSLIEESGWTEGEDGIYERDGERLSTEVFVRVDDTQRVAFMDLLAAQVRDCGIELIVRPADGETVLNPLSAYPHVPGGRDEPFEAHFVGWLQGYDPHEPLWHSDSISSAEEPDDLNFMGYSNPRVDELLDAGVATYDQRERAQIYHELQEIIAADKPVLFAWGSLAFDALDPRLGYIDGDIDPGSPQWFWQFEKLALREDS